MIVGEQKAPDFLPGNSRMRITAEQAVAEEQCNRGCDERLRFAAAHLRWGRNLLFTKQIGMGAGCGG